MINLNATHIWKGLIQAVGALTIFPTEKTSRLSISERSAFYLSFPLVGLLFGTIGYLLVNLFHFSVPILLAWLIPVTWILLSGATHFIALSRTLNALISEGSQSERTKLIKSENPSVIGVSLAILILSGKIFALLQGAEQNTASIALAVLVTPVLSRLVAVLLALSAAQPNSEENNVAPFTAVGAAVLSLLICINCLALSLMLLIVSLVLAIGLRYICLRKFGSIVPAALGALIEITEVAMLWTIVILNAHSYDLSSFALF